VRWVSSAKIQISDEMALNLDLGGSYGSTLKNTEVLFDGRDFSFLLLFLNFLSQAFGSSEIEKVHLSNECVMCLLRFQIQHA
jgi:hypothetical protein